MSDAPLSQRAGEYVEIWTDWENQRRELFEDRWPQVRLLVSALRRIGIYYMDAKPGNIMFGDEHLE